MVWLDTQTVECMYIVYSVLCSIRSTYNLCVQYTFHFNAKKIVDTIVRTGVDRTKKI